MKIITWNCNGALRNKTSQLDELGGDILIVQECEDPKLSSQKYRKWAGNYLWKGESKNKGIGVFAKNGQIINELKLNGSFSIPSINNKVASTWSTSELRLFLPFTVNDRLNILGVWTKGSENEVFGYMGQFWKYLQIHKEQLKNDSQIIIGDFNSNKRWDKKDRWWNHSDVVRELSEIGIKSLYHEILNEDQGDESTPTLYLQRNESKPYHIDYAFLSNNMISTSQLTIGKREDWISVSDHMPLSVMI